MKCKIEIYYPIVPDFKFEDYPFEQKEILISEISDVLEIGLVNLDSYIKTISSKLTIEDYNPEIFFQISKSDFYSLKENNLKFEIEAEVYLDLFEVTEHKGSETTRIIDHEILIKYLPYSLRDIYGNRIFEIFVLSQIARPGSLKIRKGMMFVNGNYVIEELPTIQNSREIIEFQKERNYPKIEYLEFKPFFEWILNNNLLFPLHPINSYQKALNNLTYIHGLEDRIGTFVYQMRILEEIYTSSINQIAEQLDTKIQLFLGKLESFKKQIKNMYNVRSKFLHGSSNVYPYHLIDNDFYNYEKSFDIEIDDASTFSLLLIISTLQRMYKKNYLELNFEYKIKGHNNGS